MLIFLKISYHILIEIHNITKVNINDQKFVVKNISEEIRTKR